MSAHFVPDDEIKDERKRNKRLRSNRGAAADVAGGPATKVIRVDGGYMVFDYVNDYKIWRRQR